MQALFWLLPSGKSIKLSQSEQNCMLDKKANNITCVHSFDRKGW